MRTIKRTLPVLIAIFIAMFNAHSAEERKGGMDITNYSSDNVLLFYKQMSKYQLIESSDVKLHVRLISVSTSDLSLNDNLKAIEKALLEQAGIVITRLDGSRVSVTFNDALHATGPLPSSLPQYNLPVKR